MHKLDSKLKKTIKAHERLSGSYTTKWLRDPKKIYDVKSRYHQSVAYKTEKENRKLSRSEKREIYLKKLQTVNELNKNL